MTPQLSGALLRARPPPPPPPPPPVQADTDFLTRLLTDIKFAQQKRVQLEGSSQPKLWENMQVGPPARPPARLSDCQWCWQVPPVLLLLPLAAAHAAAAPAAGSLTGLLSSGLNAFCVCVRVCSVQAIRRQLDEMEEEQCIRLAKYILLKASSACSTQAYVTAARGFRSSRA